MFCSSLFVLLSCWSLYYLSFLDFRFMITLLTSSKLFCSNITKMNWSKFVQLIYNRIDICALLRSIDSIGYVRLTRLVPLEEQELPALPEHLSSPPLVFSEVRVTGFMCMFCRSLFVLLSYYFFAIVLSVLLLAIVLSVLLRFKDSDYPFGIFKLF